MRFRRPTERLTVVVVLVVLVVCFRSANISLQNRESALLTEVVLVVVVRVVVVEVVVDWSSE